MTPEVYVTADKAATTRIGNYRYRILALVFMATSINYFDRTILGVLAPKLMEIFGWSEKNYSSIIISFQIAYAVGLLAMGGIIGPHWHQERIYDLNCCLELFLACFMRPFVQPLV